MIGFYNYTVLATYAGCASGILGIIFAANGHPLQAIVALMIAGFCDTFDGKIAGTMERTPNEHRFGIQIDSLSDLICFGVLPVCIGWSIGLTAWWQTAIMVFYILAALIRLAYFNVLEEDRQENRPDSKKVFYGMPVTTVALLIPFLYGLKRFVRFFPVLYTLLLAVTAFAFLANIEIKKPSLKVILILILLGIVELGFVLFF